MKRRVLLLSTLILLGFSVRHASAAVTVKLATLAPDGSIWDQAVEEMGAEWQKETDGRVQLKVYPGGVAGEESDVLRKIRIGQLHAAVLTTGGLTEIDESFQVFNIPMFFESFDELFFVLDRLTPLLSQRLEAKGYVFLGWGHAGWIHLFSKESIAKPEDFKSSKFFISAGDNRVLQWWKQKGYQPVALATTDILTGLETGMIDSLPSPPLAALMLQWYKSAPHMLDIGFAPLVGGTVVQKKIWDRISPEDQKRLLAAGKRLEERLEKEVPRQDQEAIAAMEKRGLQVVKVDGTPTGDAWRGLAANFAEEVKADWVPADVLKEALAARSAFRKAHGGSGESP